MHVKFIFFVMAAAASSTALAALFQGQASNPPKTMSNVICPAHCPDPFVTFDASTGYYYAVRSRISSTAHNLDPPGWTCWHGSQDQVIITKSRSLDSIYTSPEATSIIINRSSPFKSSSAWGGVSCGAFAVSYKKGDGCPSPGFWAPTLYNINDTWYLFVTGHRPDIRGEANFVLSSSRKDPMDVEGWLYRGQIEHENPGLDGEPVVLDVDDEFAESVVMKKDGKTITGKLYFVYSHNNHESGNDQQLRLARLVTAPENRQSFAEYDADLEENITYSKMWEVAGEAVVSVPMFEWERQACSGCSFGVNEGPAGLYGPTKTFIMYSASFCATKFYSLGLIELLTTRNDTSPFPFLWAKHPRPVFSGDRFSPMNGSLQDTTLQNAFGIGHNSVTVSPDLSESWIVYHAKTDQREGPGDREARTQRFAWDLYERPDFDIYQRKGPVAGGGEIEAPSDARSYAVLCENVDFQGRWCVGLEAKGRFEVEDLARRGIGRSVGSVRFVGSGGLRANIRYFDQETGEMKVWATNKNVAEVPREVRQGRVVAIDVEVGPSVAADF